MHNEDCLGLFRDKIDNRIRRGIPRINFHIDENWCCSGHQNCPGATNDCKAWHDDLVTGFQLKSIEGKFQGSSSIGYRNAIGAMMMFGKLVFESFDKRPSKEIHPESMHSFKYSFSFPRKEGELTGMKLVIFNLLQIGLWDKIV